MPPNLWMNKPRSTLSKSLFYLFDLYLCILMVVEMFCCISLEEDGRKEERPTIFPFLGSVVPMYLFLFYLFFILICSLPPQEGCEDEELTRKGLLGPSTAKNSSMLDIKTVLSLSFNSYHWCANSQLSSELLRFS